MNYVVLSLLGLGKFLSMFAPAMIVVCVVLAIITKMVSSNNWLRKLIYKIL